MKIAAPLFLLLSLLEMASPCSIQFDIVSLTRKRFSIQIFGPYFRYQTGEFVRGLGEKKSFHFDGSLFSCHGSYEVLITPIQGGATVYVARHLPEDSTVAIHVRNHEIGVGVLADTDYYMT
uniref:Uncharacterized protein n=1 Tax=Plectus sambesii TaxID=2011161 RepID=A0A914X4I6_9BILA